MERELKQEFGHELDEVELIAGSGGVFEVVVDGTLVFSKKQLRRFPEPGEIVRLVRC
ncbi:MAG: SelT/SelW/SelH family protein [Proteobacteria bacterium]|nr:SelT/SelW/SelH family protein [Pseudomonadota bacterium]